MEPQINDSEPYLLHILNNKRLNLEKSKQFTIGRSLCNSYVLEDLKVSRIHCSFEENDGIWSVTDKSTNGTFMNKRKIPPKIAQPLSSGDVIKLTDDHEFVFVNMRRNSFDDIDFCAIMNETEICHVGQEVEIATNIEKPDDKEASDSPALNEIASARIMLSEAVACTESVSCENYKNKDHSYTKCTNAVVEDKHFKIVPSTSSTNNDTEKVSVNKPQEDQKTQPTSTNAFEQVENELQCIICTELFIKATTLNCSHSFCKHCITEWRKKNKKCPICRTKITTANPTIVLDNFIGKILESAPDDVRQHRTEIVKSREEPPKSSSSKNDLEGAARTRNAPPIEISSDEEDNSDDDYDEIDFDDMDYYDDSSRRSTRRTPYYGGYGHCYVCGTSGHWANGCPFR
ncbi:hypothetical protein Trydic_g23563 [Trypoxylus dichotomus]